MFVVCVTIWVKEGRAEEFIEATLDNAENTRKEPGNVRFDFLRSEDEPHRFFLYEVYHRPEDFKAHQETPHYFRWRDKVADWMSQKRQGMKHHSLFYSK
jgi:autoinducer 2-degrading protein